MSCCRAKRFSVTSNEAVNDPISSGLYLHDHNNNNNSYYYKPYINFMYSPVMHCFCKMADTDKFQ